MSSTSNQVWSRTRLDAVRSNENFATERLFQTISRHPFQPTESDARPDARSVAAVRLAAAEVSIAGSIEAD